MKQDSIINCAAYRNGRKVADVSIDDISEVLKEPGVFVWLGLYEPEGALMHKIQEEFGLHELAIEDALSAHQRPKVEEYGDTLFVVLRTAQLAEKQLSFGETHLFLGPRFLVTVRHGSSAGHRKVRERCESTPARLAQGPGFAMYAVMDFIVDNYRPIVDALGERFQKLERQLFEPRFSRMRLEEQYALKRQLLQLRAAAAPVQDICNELMRHHSDLLPRGSLAYFRDISDHTRRVTEAVDTMREMLVTAMQVNLALVTVTQNEVVKRLAGWGAILAIPTMVFSLYGMNFEHMPELDWQFGYPAVLAAIATGCFWLHRRLRASGWL